MQPTDWHGTRSVSTLTSMHYLHDRKTFTFVSPYLVVRVILKRIMWHTASAWHEVAGAFHNSSFEFLWMM